MNVTATDLPGVLILEPVIHADARGTFFESWNAETFRRVVGVDAHFVQDNQARSVRHALRGIHYQLGRPQAKLVRALAGSVLDVAVDLRRSSPSFRRWIAVELSARNHRQLWIPPGFGHAYLALSEDAEVLYKITAPWNPAQERCLRWDDPEVAIAWPLASTPILSERDAAAPYLAQAEVYA